MQLALRRALLASILATGFACGAQARPLPGPSIEPAFVRARPHVEDRLETLLQAQRAAGVSPAARPPTPTNCSATDQGLVIKFTWDPVVGATGYYVFADGAIGTKLGPATTEADFSPGPGTHSYCVVSVNADGVSDPCCDTGTQTQLPAPGCSYSVGGGKVTFYWGAVAGAQGYYVYRDGVLVSTEPGNTTDYTEVPPGGDHRYCVQAFASGAETSDSCCVNYTDVLTPPGPLSPCAASSYLQGQVLIQWQPATGATEYVILRDGVFLNSVSAPTTEYTDHVSSQGSHQYCIHAINSAGSGPECCANGAAVDATVHTRLSWGTCSPQVANQAFSGPGLYTLVLSASGVSISNYGHDSTVHIQPAVPDAWRFDAAGCQTDNRLNLQVASVDSCPAMKGTNSLVITDYSLDLDGSAELRLSIVYDDLITVANQRYILWKIGFDHSNSVTGSSGPGTCGGADRQLNFGVLTQIGLTDGHYLFPAMEPGDALCTWNAGNTRTQPTTWGKVKALYR